MTNLAGQSIGRYHIIEQLGEGGMATVYKAYDTRLETDVAVKFIRTEALPQNAIERALKRFEREAKSLARLTHPNIVKVTDYGDHQGKPYLVMEYLPGGTLRQRLQASAQERGFPGRLGWQDAINLLLPIVRALDYAHRQGMIHRDVKPANILITADGEPMLTDFGVAKILDLEDGQTLTGTGVGIGTPEYMAPEQWTNQTVPQSDMYGLGVVLYEMVTGRKPYEADTPAGILIKQSSQPLPLPHKYAPGLPEGLERLLLKMLAPAAENRYPDMGTLATAMKALLAEPDAGQSDLAGVGITRDDITIPENPKQEQARHQAIKPTAPRPAIGTVSSPTWKHWGRWGLVIGLLALVALFAWLFSSTNILAVSPTPTATPSPVIEATATSTPTLTPTPTLTFTPTSSPTQTATPTPLAEVLPAGKWKFSETLYCGNIPELIQGRNYAVQKHSIIEIKDNGEIVINGWITSILEDGSSTQQFSDTRGVWVLTGKKIELRIHGIYYAGEFDGSTRMTGIYSWKNYPQWQHCWTAELNQ